MRPAARAADGGQPSGFFGGTASYFNTWLYSIGKGILFNVYLIVVAIIASVAVLTWKDNKGKPLDQIT